ncbi:MAG: hypothetical protein MSS80_08070 [Mollicutes bacterium]|nr:hypothetical protein [Mollicutes bacterium]
MGKYIEKDFKVESAKKVAKAALKTSGANETENGLIVKAGFLNKTKNKIVEKTDESHFFSFVDCAKKSHMTIGTNETISDSLQKILIKIGYEIIISSNLDWAYINIYSQNENYKFERFSIPEKLFLVDHPEDAFIHFLESRLDIIERHIKVGVNSEINGFLKQKSWGK